MINEVLYKSNRNGQRRAYYYSRPCMRWMPLSIAKADMLVASGQATEVGRLRMPTASELKAEATGDAICAALTD